MNLALKFLGDRSKGADPPGMDFSILPAGDQAQLAQLSIDQGVLSSLPAPQGGSPAAAAFSPAAAKLDLSAQAQQLLAGGTSSTDDPGSDSAPGPGWELGYDPSANTGYDTGPAADYSWVYNG